MEENVSILIVEDEPRIRSGLIDFLEFHDYMVTAVEDGLEAQRAVRDHRYDLILLDLMLPKISGEDLCRQWRQNGLTTPIIMLTAKGQEREKINGLDLGADDYVTKPFSLEELLARIRAILRRTDPARSVGQRFQFGSLQVDISGLKVIVDGQEIPISKRQAMMIQTFAANPNRVISREELYEKVWGESMNEIETRTVDMHIAKLRSKIEPDPNEPTLIKTVRGVGYMYESQ
ncbi:MAG: response regulator transcription factor [Sedimentisphaerales bacterium]|nr:response regulator transcription factor [Sedimentisphaerales bacterium]